MTMCVWLNRLYPKVLVAVRAAGYPSFSGKAEPFFAQPAAQFLYRQL